MLYDLKGIWKEEICSCFSLRFVVVVAKWRFDALTDKLPVPRSDLAMELGGEIMELGDDREGGIEVENEAGEPLFHDALSRWNSSSARLSTHRLDLEHHKDSSSNPNHGLMHHRDSSSNPNPGLMLHGDSSSSPDPGIMLHKESSSIPDHDAMLHKDSSSNPDHGAMLHKDSSQESSDRRSMEEERSLRSNASSLSKRFGKSLSLLETPRGCIKETFIGQPHDSPASASASSRNLGIMSPVFPAKCQNEGMGWPFGISSCVFDPRDKRRASSSSRGVRVNPSDRVSPSPPPVPPSPSTGSWLDKAISLHKKKQLPLFSHPEKEKAAGLTPSCSSLSSSSSSMRKKLDFALTSSSDRLSFSKPNAPSARKKLDFALPDELPFISSDFACVDRNPESNLPLSAFIARADLVSSDVPMPSMTVVREHNKTSSSAHEKKKVKNRKQQVMGLGSNDPEVSADVRWEDIVKERRDVEEGHLRLSKVKFFVWIVTSKKFGFRNCSLFYSL